MFGRASKKHECGIYSSLQLPLAPAMKPDDQLKEKENLMRCNFRGLNDSLL